MPINESDKKLMLLALELAGQAYNDDEVPIGCVIADSEGKVIGRGRNRRERANNAIAHAEIEAINMACNQINNWRLSGCTAYVTLEPCPMCKGAFRAARIERVVYGAANTNPNAVGTEPDFEGGFMEEECRVLLSSFFKAKR